MRPWMTGALAALALWVLVPNLGQAQGRPSRLELEIRPGVLFGTDFDVGQLIEADDFAGYNGPYRSLATGSYFRLEGTGTRPSIAVSVRLPALWLGARPVLEASKAFATGVGATWVPCAPGLPCADILIRPDVEASRIAAVAGFDLPVPVPIGGVETRIGLGLGLRHYGLSWAELGEPGTFVLPAGSHGEDDLLVRAGAGIAFRLGRFAVVGRADVDQSRFGSGVVSVPLLRDPGEFDLGRRTLREVTLSLGLGASAF